MKLGLMLAGDADDVPEVARWAEDVGFDLVAAGEHVLFGSPTSNAFVSLAAAAAVTSRVRLLSAVTLLPLYPAALAAKMAVTLDRVSGGRFELGVGVGGENPAEFAAVGVPVSARGRRTDEALPTVRTYLHGGSVAGHAMDPPPVRPVPIWIGGRSEAAMRRAGRAGDVWMPYLCSPDRVARGLRLVDDVAVEQGRGPVGGGLLAWSAVADSRAEARRLAVGKLQEIYGQDMDRIVDACVPYGTPDDVAARLREYADAGAEQVLYAPLSPDRELGAALCDRLHPRTR
ncbi:LLM class flavin-dependent oxidoreductase [Actinomycetospora sp. OC33-EN08]|uniref:LLM class flavin-dependent oxidoreductase n=1 Tax=Actinomycetospora aurantiaca TaxID=3129233 RepID=A0ABU8MFV1_9PSEU